MMNDERLSALFEVYEEPVEPSLEFLDRLELELRRRVGHARRPLGWRLQTLVEAVSPRVAPPLRAVWAMTLLALLLVLASAAALVGARLLGVLPTAEQVVLASQAVYADPPAFEMEVRGTGGHGAMPHLSADAIVIAAHVVTSAPRVAQAIGCGDGQHLSSGGQEG